MSIKSIVATIAALASVASALPAYEASRIFVTSSKPTDDASSASSAGTAVSVTPHEQFESSMGVLGCKSNINRMAYFPDGYDCNKICIQVTYQSRSLYLLKIGSSTGAYDISYDAWNYLQTGKSATEDPIYGGGVEMSWKYVDNENCMDLFDDGKIKVVATNPGCSSGWVAERQILTDIKDDYCLQGADIPCHYYEGSSLVVCDQAKSATNPLGLAGYTLTAPEGVRNVTNIPIVQKAPVA